MKIINIKIYNGSEWIDYTLGSLTDLNIQNAEGVDSIIQKYSGEVDTTHFGNTNTGENAAVFGEANSNSASRALMSGKLNVNSGSNSIISGLANGRGIDASPNLAPLTGNNLMVGGKKNQNLNNGDDTIISGQSNTNNGAKQAIISGVENTVRSVAAMNGDRIIVSGYKNQNFNADSILSGANNINNSYGTFTIGERNINNSRDSIMAGRYATGSSDTLLELGNGKDIVNRSNAFEVTTGGIARAFGKPVKENDVVRLKELNTLNTEIDAKLDAGLNNKVDKIAGDGKYRYVYTIEANGSVSKLNTLGAGALAVTDAYAMLKAPSLSGFNKNATDLTYTPKGYVDTSITLTDAEIEEIFA